MDRSADASCAGLPSGGMSGEILSDYVADLAGVVERAREGAFVTDRAAKAY